MVGAISHDDFIAGMVRETEPGTVCRYNSGDTQALGHLLVKATGRSITDYMQDKLFEPLGMVDPGYWLIDRTGMEMAYAGLNLTARDYAKLGELYRLGGKWNGQQIVPADWVKASVRWDAPHPKAVSDVLDNRHVREEGVALENGGAIALGGRPLGHVDAVDRQSPDRRRAL